MDPVDHFRRLFRYDDWANREALASLGGIASPPARSIKLLAHIVGAEWLWLARLEAGAIHGGPEGPRPPQGIVVWPDLPLAECGSQLTQLESSWEMLLRRATEDALLATVAYTNSKGEPWVNTVHDILMHVVMHSAYHRGQIAMDVRAAGHTPAYTDFIHAVRTNRV